MTKARPPLTQRGGRATVADMSVLALGDSITRGLNTVVGDLPSRSYAHWLADSLGTEAIILADAGITARQALERLGAKVTGRHDVGVVFVGVNDALAARWKPDVFRDSHAELLCRVGEHADVVATMTVPAYAGRFLGKRSTAVLANEIIRRNAAEARAVVVDLGDLSGSRRVWSDQVHPTSWGQVEIADRLADALGLTVRPSDLAAGRMADPGWRYTAKYLWRGSRYAARQTATRVVRAVR